MSSYLSPHRQCPAQEWPPPVPRDEDLSWLTGQGQSQDWSHQPRRQTEPSNRSESWGNQVHASRFPKVRSPSVYIPPFSKHARKTLPSNTRTNTVRSMCVKQIARQCVPPPRSHLQTCVLTSPHRLTPYSSGSVRPCIHHTQAACKTVFAHLPISLLQRNHRDHGFGRARTFQDLAVTISVPALAAKHPCDECKLRKRRTWCQALRR